MRWKAASAFVFTVVVATGCADGELPLDFLDTGGSAPVQCAEPVAFEDVMAVLEQSCAAIPSCHGSSSGIGLVLTAEAAYERLVGQPALLSDKLLVDPGAPDESFVVDKLLARNGATLMPPQGPLSAEAIEVVACWIEQGAEP